MRILLITDQAPDSQHSAIRGIFDHHLRERAEVTLVWFSRNRKDIAAGPDHVTLPWHYRRHGIWWHLAPPLPLPGFDIVIVRNLFPVLSALTRMENRSFRLGFWESFPHRYRRLYEAERTGKAIWRKRLEYRICSRTEQRLVSRCDFYLPITATYAQRFRPGLTLPLHPLPMGVDAESLPKAEAVPRPEKGTLRLFYAGAADALRGFDLILPALCRSDVDFVLDIYTFTPGSDALQPFASDARIRIHPALPRRELLARMPSYDLGLSLIPPTPLYEVSSPTKTLEYFAMELPALMTPIPEHLELFSDLKDLLTPFCEEDIMLALKRFAALPREKRHTLAATGRDIVFAHRSYRVLAHGVHAFLENLR